MRERDEVRRENKDRQCGTSKKIKKNTDRGREKVGIRERKEGLRKEKREWGEIGRESEREIGKWRMGRNRQIWTDIDRQRK